jgi:hypothetical protein
MASHNVTVDLDRTVVSACEDDNVSAGSIEGCNLSDEEPPGSAAKNIGWFFGCGCEMDIKTLRTGDADLRF